MISRVLEKIESRKAVIGVVGLGYVGLPLVREFLDKDFSVIGFDIDPEKVEMITAGKSYIKHLHNDFLVKYVLEEKMFEATDNFSRLKEVDHILICVPTPLDSHYNPDLSYVIDTTKVVAEHMVKGQSVVLESTTYPGTTEEEMMPVFEEKGLLPGRDYYLGYSPEREDPGNKDFDTGTIPKVISGVTEDCLKVMEAMYSTIVTTVPVSSTKVAESSKILENTFRAVNIALVNELKIVFDRMDIDIWEVIEAAKTKPFGFKAFYPGPGLGGHCIPIDPFYLTWKAKEYDIFTRFIELSGEINDSMPYYVMDKILKSLNEEGIPMAGAKVLVVGASYKPNIDDLRESPALKIIDLLQKEDVEVQYYDPYIPVIPRTRKYNSGLSSLELDKIEKEEFDLAVIVTDHEVVDYEVVAEKAKRVVDTRNAMKLNGIKEGKIWKA